MFIFTPKIKLVIRFFGEKGFLNFITITIKYLDNPVQTKQRRAQPVPVKRRNKEVKQWYCFDKILFGNVQVTLSLVLVMIVAYLQRIKFTQSCEDLFI